MEHNLSNTVALLTRTPAVLDALLRNVPDDWTRSNEGGDTWSAFDVIGHLIHAERTDWMPRVRTIRNLGTAAVRAFRPVGARSGGAGQVPRALAGRVCPRACRQPRCPPGLEPDPGRPRPARSAPDAGTGHTLPAAGDVGGSRPDAPAPALASDGAPVSRRGWTVEPVPWASISVPAIVRPSQGGRSPHLTRRLRLRSTLYRHNLDSLQAQSRREVVASISLT